MALTQTQLAEQLQRVRVDMERTDSEKRVKIRIENYDQQLGWYTAGSVSLPLHQLPLLEQAVEEMRRSGQSDESAQIIPFPRFEQPDLKA
jgi:hypothetical protein